MTKVETFLSHFDTFVLHFGSGASPSGDKLFQLSQMVGPTNVRSILEDFAEAFEEQFSLESRGVKEAKENLTKLYDVAIADMQSWLNPRT